LDGTDVLITHGPPYGIGDDSGMEERAGCEELLVAVQRVRPLLHLFGHIHQAGGVWQIGPTRYANVTTWECERGPTVLEIDQASRRVVPVTVPPGSRRRRPIAK
jgi:Icc-related predicted phosphoesterase